ncbi:Pentatricopeptide repeat-containing protein At3g48250, chloroplastic-like [Zea mays]|uniref:Pentatricopeptide repeat-containing protein chloroplastic n=1 Tax=Zea mays TaxID=4577 RepID=A0A1D6N0A4_MAIZE|nr:Pentatricopeptide repeat-containing protein At3g48250, chloroplastic-like [Zea mays]ONM34218.1 Pentatricopeptide repeat-containing protein chloroplastic [Zea mays]|eukprot:XP_020405927.1 pentatricopeptide repeat-containing protein At3g48250, chloroplastic [Zea mays]
MAALPLLRRLLAHRRLLSTTATTPAASSSNPPTPEAVLYAIHSLSKDPSQALAVFRRSAAAGKPVGSAAYNLMLRTLASHPSSAQRHFWPFLREMQEAGHSVDQGTYLAALASFKKASLTADYASLTAHYDKFRKGDKSAAAAAAEAVRDHDAAGLDSRLADIGLLPLTETAVITVLRELREHPIKALAFFRWAGRQQGYTHSSVSYNAMARVLGREESVPEFWELIREMKGAGMYVDIDTYLKLSRNFQKRHMVREAVELYELMMDGPFKPGQQDGPIIIRRISLGPSPDLELVNRVVNKFEAVWGVKTKELLDGVHRALTSNGLFDEAAEIVQTMRDQGHQPDNITYSQLVYGLCKADKLENARKVLDEMEAEGCVPDLKTWTLLIQGHCVAGDVDRAVQYFTEMIEKGLDADGDVLDVILKGLCSHEKVEEAYSLFVEMVDKAELRPWQGTCQHLIGDLLRVNKLEEALALLKTMKTCKFPPFADPFPPYIAKYGTVEDARNFFKALTVKTSPAPAAYLHVLKLFFAEGRYSEAQDLLYKCPIYIRKHPHVAKLFESIKIESASAS